MANSIERGSIFKIGFANKWPFGVKWKSGEHVECD